MTHRTRSARQSAFTMLELLVVIAVLTVLIGIMLPSLKGARRQAKDTQCLNRLRGIYVAHATYLHDHDRFPPLNNEEDEGAWQYNYLIFDGRDFEANFGPLIHDGVTVDTPELFHCPVQKDPYHSLATPQNPWPVVLGTDTRAGYARRHKLSGKSLSQLPEAIAMVADLIHKPDVVQSAHKTGVNVVYTDGHAIWVRDTRERIIDSDLTTPFRIEDNDAVKKIWRMLDESQ